MALTSKQPTPRPAISSRPSKICYEWNHSPLPIPILQILAYLLGTLKLPTYPTRPCSVNGAALLAPRLHHSLITRPNLRPPTRDTTRTDVHTATKNRLPMTSLVYGLGYQAGKSLLSLIMGRVSMRVQLASSLISIELFVNNK